MKRLILIFIIILINISSFAYMSNDSSLCNKTVTYDIDLMDRDDLLTLKSYSITDTEYIRYILLPKTIKRVNDFAFSDNVYIDRIVFNDYIEYISDYAFMRSNVVSIKVVGYKQRELVYYNASMGNTLLNFFYSDLAYKWGLLNKCDVLLTCRDRNPTIYFNNGLSVDLWSYFTPRYRDLNGVLYTWDGLKLVYYPNLKRDPVYEIPKTVQVVGDVAFNNCKYLKELRVPKGLHIPNVCTVGSSFKIKYI